MTFKELADPNAKTSFMLTNEAIARAVLESNVKVTAFYPGSLTSEILNSLYRARYGSNGGTTIHRIPKTKWADNHEY